MTSSPDDLVLTHHASGSARSILDALCVVYADAYGVEPAEEKTSAFGQRTLRGLDVNGFELVTAEVDGDLVGFGFGYPLPEGHSIWWRGLQPEPTKEFVVETGSRTFLLAEIEIRQAWQGKGIGRRVHDELLSGRSEERATLTANPEATDTHALYEGWGWQRLGEAPGRPGAYFATYAMFLLPLSKDGSR